jgi:hypothetical protein
MGENRNGAEDEIRRDSVKSVSSGEGDRLLQDDDGDVSTTTGKSEGWGFHNHQVMMLTMMDTTIDLC